ncbi:uncharacterized protein LW93_9908 [Fusarium fujikuroi]|nr:uncharacterized protein LW93_9908 [Fusarium fujikuroi]
MSNPPQVHDLMIVFDAVAGGAAGVTALKQAITDIINFVSLSDCFERIGVLAYRNYPCAAELITEWSGWCKPCLKSGFLSADQILKFVEHLQMPTVGSASKPNCASKAALAKAYLEMGINGTIILLYAHDPPMLGLEHISGAYYKVEQEFLPKKYGELGNCFKDWINGAHLLAGIASVPSGTTKKAVVLSFALGSADNLNDDTSYWSPYLYLSAVTNGNFFRTIYSGRIIFRLTIGLLLFWMGADGNIDIPESIRMNYKDDPTNVGEVSEANLAGLCGSNYSNVTSEQLTMLRNDFHLLYSSVSTHNEQVSKLTSRNVARKYIDGTATYKNFIAKHLNRIIKTNISGIAFHPLYGQLFRTVCEDQTGDKLKTTLLQKFRAQVNLIPDDKDKKQTQNWLEESYTLFHEINEEILALPAHLQFPLVYIPPGQSDSGLTRTQLLSMWESCDMDTLKPLGDILTRVHRVEEKKDMPDNMSQWWPCLAPRIPLALMDNKYPSKF